MTQFNQLSFLQVFFNYLKQYIIKDQKSDDILMNKFRMSLLLIVSGSFFEKELTTKLLDHASNLLKSYDTVKLSGKNIKYRYLLNLAVQFFHSITKSIKYKKALYLLAKSMDFNSNNVEIDEKINKITEILSEIEPIIVDGIQFNGMISSDFNFFISSNFENLLANISEKKKEMKGSSSALMCALVRLIIHETTHLIIGFLNSKKNKDFNGDENIPILKGGYKMEEILIGSCCRIFYDQNCFIDKFLDKKIWDDDHVPIFSPDELETMDPITKNFVFSGIDNEDIYGYE